MLTAIRFTTLKREDKRLAEQEWSAIFSLYTFNSVCNASIYNHSDVQKSKKVDKVMLYNY